MAGLLLSEELLGMDGLAAAGVEEPLLDLSTPSAKLWYDVILRAILDTQHTIKVSGDWDAPGAKIGRLNTSHHLDWFFFSDESAFTWAVEHIATDGKEDAARELFVRAYKNLKKRKFMGLRLHGSRATRRQEL